ncbi:protein FAM131C isoform X2 [Brachyhypopomus gauderio]
MGACLRKGHQEHQNDQEHSTGEPHSWAEGHANVKGNHQPFKGSATATKSSSGYNIGELATSSLMGLVATIKEHITKPTAMAQGRVAHLIEWKGWGGETAAAAAGGGWSGWGGAGATLQEHEQLYSHLTDELKEARFAAGVAEQFALAEAALNVWPSQDIADQATTSTAPLQGQDGLYLSQILMGGGCLGIRQPLYSLHVEATSDASSLTPTQTPLAYVPNSVCCQPESQDPLQDKRTSLADGSVQHADSSSLSEDEVFYN